MAKCKVCEQFETMEGSDVCSSFSCIGEADIEDANREIYEAGYNEANRKTERVLFDLWNEGEISGIEYKTILFKLGLLSSDDFDDLNQMRADHDLPRFIWKERRDEK